MTLYNISYVAILETNGGLLFGNAFYNVDVWTKDTILALQQEIATGLKERGAAVLSTTVIILNAMPLVDNE